MTQQIAASRRVNRRCSRGTGSCGGAGGQALAAVCWARLAAILKPAGRVRVLGVGDVAARCWRLWAARFRAKKSPAG